MTANLNHKLRLTAIALGSALFAAGAVAQTPGADTMQRHSVQPQTNAPGGEQAATPGDTSQYSKLDANHDGKISKQEAAKEPTLEKHWKAADVNRDNKIDRGEFARFEAQQTSPKR